MAISLGSLVVDLRANSAEFVSGLNKAGEHAEKSGKRIERSFAHLGAVFQNLLGPLGNFGQQISAVTSEIGEALGGTMEHTAKLGGELTALGAAVVAALPARRAAGGGGDFCGLSISFSGAV